MFHQAANCIQKKFHGKIPKTTAELRKLPGIGRYTAGAIASIAWDEKTPVLDGNVVRVLSRTFAVSQCVEQSTTLEKLWTIAASLLPAKNSGDFNQSLMELGATVCSPLDPQCTRCPVKMLCIAHQKGKEVFYPIRSQKTFYEKMAMAALVLQNDKNEVWLEKQPAEGRWGGLWMFPFWTHKQEMQRELRPSGLQWIRFLIISHAFTKYKIRLDVFGSRYKKKTFLKRPAGKWVSIVKLPRMAFPSPHRKIAQALTARKTPELSFS